MKFRTYHILFLLCFGLWLVVGCERKVEMEFPPHKPLLVLHGYIDLGDTVMVSLGKTVKIDELPGDTATYVDNGWVLLYVNGVFADSLQFDSGRRRYVSSHITAQTGSTYKVRAGAPGFGDVEGEAKAPLPVPTVSLEVKDSARATTTGTLLSDISFSFNDPSSERNHYLLNVIYRYGLSYECVYSNDPAVERYKGDLLPFDQNSCIYNTEIFFNDESFNGQLKKMTISGSTDYLQPYVDPLTGQTMKAYIKRFNISEDYYRYLKTWLAAEFNVGTLTLASPVIIRGNIRNGYGLFTVFASTTDTLN